MAFVAITTGEITTGQPVSASTQTKIKNNFDDHEARIHAAELFTDSFLNIVLRVNGQYPVRTGVLKTTINETMTLTGIRILVDQAGSSGTVQIDLKVKRGAGAFTSVLSTLPSVAFGAGNDSISTNAVLDPTQVDLQAGDIIRLDITSGQVLGDGFSVRIDYTRN